MKKNQNQRKSWISYQRERFGEEWIANHGNATFLLKNIEKVEIDIAYQNIDINNQSELDDLLNPILYNVLLEHVYSKCMFYEDVIDSMHNQLMNCFSNKSWHFQQTYDSLKFVQEAFVCLYGGLVELHNSPDKKMALLKLSSDMSQYKNVIDANNICKGKYLNPNIYQNSVLK